jgi:hypothetical protein
MYFYAVDAPRNFNQARAEKLLYAESDEIIALAEIHWREHAKPPGAPPNGHPVGLDVQNRWPAWPERKTTRILDDYQKVWWAAPGAPVPVAGVAPPVPDHRDHLVYAYLIEKTGIFEIFRRASELHKSGVGMLTRSNDGQRFWRMADNLIFSAPSQNTVWDLACQIDRDEQARRRLLYSTFGFELTASEPPAQGNIRQASTASNREFIANFEAFGYEVWRGIVNRNNNAGANDTNYEAIVTQAKWLQHSLQTMRQRSSLSLEEFRAVGVMSLLHLAVSFNSSVVKDFNAEANEPADRLDRIGQRVGIAANPNARALFEIAPYFSSLLQLVETNEVSNSAQAERLCKDRPYCDLAAKVTYLYPKAMGRDLTARRTEVVAFPANVRVQRALALQAP